MALSRLYSGRPRIPILTKIRASSELRRRSGLPPIQSYLASCSYHPPRVLASRPRVSLRIVTISSPQPRVPPSSRHPHVLLTSSSSSSSLRPRHFFLGPTIVVARVSSSPSSFPSSPVRVIIVCHRSSFPIVYALVPPFSPFLHHSPRVPITPITPFSAPIVDTRPYSLFSCLPPFFLQDSPHRRPPLSDESSASRSSSFLPHPPQFPSLIPQLSPFPSPVSPDSSVFAFPFPLPLSSSYPSVICSEILDSFIYLW